MSTLNLTEFLLARIAEDKGVAENRAQGAPIHEVGCFYYNYNISPRVWTADCCDCTDETKARALAECEAKRRIVALHSLVPDPEPDDDWLGSCRTCTTGGPDAQGWPCDTLKALALPYANHADYREGWRA